MINYNDKMPIYMFSIFIVFLVIVAVLITLPKLKKDCPPCELYKTGQRSSAIILGNTETRVIWQGREFHFAPEAGIPHKETHVIKRHNVN